MSRHRCWNHKSFTYCLLINWLLAHTNVGAMPALAPNFCRRAFSPIIPRSCRLQAPKSRIKKKITDSWRRLRKALLYCRHGQSGYQVLGALPLLLWSSSQSNGSHSTDTDQVANLDHQHWSLCKIGNELRNASQISYARDSSALQALQALGLYKKQRPLAMASRKGESSSERLVQKERRLRGLFTHSCEQKAFGF